MQGSNQELRSSRAQRYIARGIILLIVVLSLVYVRGWTSLEYDKNDKEIGKTVVFSRQMVWVSSLPKGMIRRAIAEKYGSMLREKTGWVVSSTWFPDVTIEDIPCDDKFLVKEAFYNVPHGISQVMFSPEVNKYYVLGSEKYETTIVTEIAYEAYSKDVGSVADDGDCVSNR